MTDIDHLDPDHANVGLDQDTMLAIAASNNRAKIIDSVLSKIFALLTTVVILGTIVVLVRGWPS